jgi:hypothetical protein
MGKTLEISEEAFQKVMEMAAQTEEAPEQTLERLIEEHCSSPSSLLAGATMEHLSLPEGTEVHLHLDVTTRLNVSADLARRRAGKFLLRKVGNLLRPDEPRLFFSDRLYWMVPVSLTNPTMGRVGGVGELQVDAQTGEVLAGKEDVERIERNALALYNTAAL